MLVAYAYNMPSTSVQLHLVKLQNNQNIICPSQKSSLGWILNSSMKQYTWELPPSFLVLELSLFCFLNLHFIPGHAILTDTCSLDCED